MTARTAPLPQAPTAPTHDHRVIALICSAHGLSHFYQILLASLFAFIAPELNLSYTQLGVLITLFFFASGVGQIAAGFAVDALGGRRLLIAGLSMCGAAYILAGLSSGFAGLAIAAFCAGMGNSVFHPADFSLLNERVSPARLPWAFSLHGIGGNIGYVLAPIYAVFAQKWFGWHGALLLAGVGGLLWALVLALNTSLVTGKRSSATPQSFADLTAREMIAPLVNPVIFFAFAFFCIATFYSVSISSFGPALFRDVHNISIEKGTLLLSWYLIAQTLGMFVGGWIGAKGFAPGRTASAATVCAALIACALLVAPLSEAVLVCILLAMGLCVGVVAPSRDLLVKKAAPKQALGRAYGVVYAGFDLGASIVPVIYGALIDRKLGLAVFGFAVASLFANAAIAWWLDRRVEA